MIPAKYQRLVLSLHGAWSNSSPEHLQAFRCNTGGRLSMGICTSSPDPVASREPLRRSADPSREAVRLPGPRRFPCV